MCCPYLLLANSKLIQKMLLKFQEHQLRELLTGSLRTRMAEVVERAQQRPVPLFALLGERECGLWLPPALNRVRQWHVDPPLRACRALCLVIDLHTITDDHFFTLRLARAGVEITFSHWQVRNSLFHTRKFIVVKISQTPDRNPGLLEISLS